MKKIITCGLDYILESFSSRLKITISLFVYFIKKWVTPAKPLFSSLESSSRMLWLVKLSWMNTLNFYLLPVAEVMIRFAVEVFTFGSARVLSISEN